MANEKRMKRMVKQRSVGISDDLIEKIKYITKDYMSVSSFIRIAIIKELERYRNK